MKNIFDIQIAEKVLSENEDIKNYGYITHKYTGVLLEKVKLIQTGLGDR